MGHQHVDFLKIDIEGSEYDVFSEWKIGSAILPAQIALELHWNDIYFGSSSFKKANEFSNLLWPEHEITLSDMSLLVGHMANIGYAIVSREDNPLCAHCTELTLIRVVWSTCQ